LSKTNPVKFADQLRHACHTIGFFLLHHDIIPPTTCFRALDETRQFFSRPMHEKMMISYENHPSFRGYMPMGVENTEGQIDGREQIEYAAEYFYPSNNNLQDTQYYRRLKATNPWPDEIQSTLRPAIADYVSGVLDISDQLRDAMCLALNVDAESFASLFGKHQCNNNNIIGPGQGRIDDDPPFWSMKLVSYPPMNGGDNLVRNGKNAKSNQGVGAHTDSNFLTLILQDPVHSGLQVQTVDGTWIDVPPTDSNTLVCNIGELAEIWTDGYFLATPHRVLRHFSNENDGTLTCRTSLPIFYNPKLDTVMKPMVDIKDLPWDRKQQNQWRRKNNIVLGSVGENSFKSLARSHTNVFQRHHSDLRILYDGRIMKK